MVFTCLSDFSLWTFYTLRKCPWKFSIRALFCLSHILFLALIMQYMRLELLHVMFVLHWSPSCVTLQVIVPAVLSLGQYMYCSFAMHWFCIMLGVFIFVEDQLLLDFISDSFLHFLFLFFLFFFFLTGTIVNTPWQIYYKNTSFKYYSVHTNKIFYISAIVLHNYTQFNIDWTRGTHNQHSIT